MRMPPFGSFVAVVSLLLASACGGSPATETKTPGTEAKGDKGGKAAAQTIGRTALEVLAEPGEIGALIDARRFRASPLFTVALVALEGTPYDKLEERFDKECRFRLFDAIGSIAYRASEDSGVLAIDVNRSRDEIYACAKALVGPMPDARVAGEPALLVDPEQKVYLLFDRGVLLVGDEDLLVKFHKDPPASVAVRGKYALGEGEVARVDLASYSRLPSAFTAVTARVISTSTELTAKARARIAEGQVKSYLNDATTAVSEMKAKLAKSGATEGVALVDSISLTSEGDDLLLSVGTKGDAIAQTKYLGNLSALVTYEMRRYVNNAKATEARTTVQIIAKRIVSAAEGGKGKTSTCPASAPRVPKETPKGKAYQSATSDWDQGTWRAIGFGSDIPQRYSYEIVTAKDKKSCKVVARGDLDGNGKESRFEIDVRFGKDGPTVGKLIETDPEE